MRLFTVMCPGRGGMCGAYVFCCCLFGNHILLFFVVASFLHCRHIVPIMIFLPQLAFVEYPCHRIMNEWNAGCRQDRMLNLHHRHHLFNRFSFRCGFCLWNCFCIIVGYQTNCSTLADWSCFIEKKIKLWSWQKKLLSRLSCLFLFVPFKTDFFHVIVVQNN